jgi:hypothetical protein
VHMAEVRYLKPMLFLELPPELFPVDFERA